MATTKGARPNERSLPGGWEWTTVADLAEDIQYGYTQSANSEEVGPKFLRITDIQDGRVDWGSVPYCEASEQDVEKYRLQQDDIVFARTGATTGKSLLIRDCPDAVFASYLIRLRLKPARSVKYFYYFLQSSEYWAQITSVKKGSAQPGVNATILATLRLPLAPLPEQERIVSRIEELFSDLDAGVAALERVRAGLKRYSDSVLKAAVEGRLLEDRGIVRGNGLPEGWQWAQVEDLNPPGRKCAYGVLQPGTDQEDGVLFVRVGDINAGRIDAGNLKRIDPQIDAQYPRTKLQGGEVLISLVGAIGRTAVVPRSLAGANTARAVGVIPIRDDVHAPWVEIWFRNPEKIAEMTSKAHEVARKTLNLEDVRAATVALPPLEEQRQIVAEVERRLSVVRQIEQAVDAGLARAARLRQAVLKAAFEGRLH